MLTIEEKKQTAKSISARYVKRDNKFVSSNFEFYLDDLTAYSYGWWKFVSVWNGKVIFNDVSYSNSTSKHQSKARSILRKAGIKIDLVLHETKGGLRCEEAAIIEEIKCLRYDNTELRQEIAKKGSWRSTNERRKYYISKNYIRMFKLMKFLRDNK